MKRVLLLFLALMFVIPFSACKKTTTVSELFNGSTALIVYNCDSIAKDARVNAAYVIVKNQCKKYICDTTLGELSKMSDSEVLEMLKEEYRKGLERAIVKWSSAGYYADICNGNATVYTPDYQSMKYFLITDDTGNTVVNEIIVFPTAGICNDPYVLSVPGTEYPPNDLFYNENLELWSFPFGAVPEDQIRITNDLFCIADDTLVEGTVYDSTYYGLKCRFNEWIPAKGLLVYRSDRGNVSLDSLTPSDLAIIDPARDDYVRVSDYYKAGYLSFFKPVEPNLIPDKSE